MNIVRRLPAKLLIQRDLPHRGFDKIGAAYNLCYALKVVINHHGEVIGKQPVATVNDKIFACKLWICLNFTAQLVSKLHHRVTLLYADCRLLWSEA